MSGSKMEFIAHCHTAIFSGLIIIFLDGGYSANLPILDGHTVTVSPFCGSSDICPQDETMFSSLQVRDGCQ